MFTLPTSICYRQRYFVLPASTTTAFRELKDLHGLHRRIGSDVTHPTDFAPASKTLNLSSKTMPQNPIALVMRLLTQPCEAIVRQISFAS